MWQLDVYDLTGFQTLIGTVQSGDGLRGPSLEGAVSNPHRYGSKLVALRPSLALSFKFQTLIGTVQSIGRLHYLPRPLKVSNPHRYGSKMEDTVLQGDCQAKFQTLIGTVQSIYYPCRFCTSLQSFKPS